MIYWQTPLFIYTNEPKEDKANRAIYGVQLIVQWHDVHDKRIAQQFAKQSIQITFCFYNNHDCRLPLSKRLSISNHAKARVDWSEFDANQLRFHAAHVRFR